MLGQDLASLIIPPAMRADHHRGLKKYLAGGEGPVLNKRLELTAVRRGGEEFRVELTIAAMDSDPPTFTGFVRDITERRRAEETLRANEERYRTLFESIDQGFCLIDVIFDAREPADRLSCSSRSTRRSSGRRASSTPSIESVSLLVPGLERHWFDAYGKVALTGEPLKFENNAVPMGRYFDVFAFPRRRRGEPAGGRAV